MQGNARSSRAVRAATMCSRLAHQLARDGRPSCWLEIPSLPCQDLNTHRLDSSLSSAVHLPAATPASGGIVQAFVLPRLGHAHRGIISLFKSSLVVATMHDGEGPAAAAMRKMQDGAGASATGASMASALRVSSAAEPPEISETDKFLFTYLGHRSPVVPLGVRCRTCQASTAGAQGTAGLTLMAPRPCARGRLRDYSGHSGLGLQPIQGWQQEGVAVLYAGARHCPGKRQRQRTP